MVSLKDIANECHVSIATVSKALNGHADIGSDTKNKVCQVAKEMGYVPNSAAKALKTDRTYNIGVLFADEAGSGLTHDYFSFVLDSFKRAAEKRGYDITFINADKTRHNRMTYLEHSRYRRFDGVALACIDFTDPEVVELAKSTIPIVSIDYTFRERMAVMSDNISGIQDLLTHVYNLGHRKVAFIHGTNSSVARSRVTSFYRTAEELGINIPDEYIMEGAYRSTSDAYKATNKLLDLMDPPTCIFYPDDFASLGGIKAIRERNLSIPDDISVVGYDGIRVLRHTTPKLTTLRQDTEGLGSTAANSLIDLIEHPKTTLIQQFVISGKVFEGGTVATLDTV